jgi:hypothetical protein
MLRIGGEIAVEVRRWITAELIDRIGREAVVTFEQRAANEVKERAIQAREARSGDVYVTRDNGLYVRREVVDVKSYASSTQASELACPSCPSTTCATRSGPRRSASSRSTRSSG